MDCAHFLTQTNKPQTKNENMSKKTNIAIGDRVAYSAKFLRSIAGYTGEMPFLRGTVRDIREFRSGTYLAVIEWTGDPYLDEEGNLPRVNVLNLARVGTPDMNA